MLPRSASLFCILVCVCTVFGDGQLKFVVNKCCPKGQWLEPVEAEAVDDEQLQCTALLSDDLISTDELSWFPMDLIVNATTLHVHRNRIKDYRTILENKYEVFEGVRPVCSQGIRLLAFYQPEDNLSQFNFIMNKDGSMSFYVSTTGSFAAIDGHTIDFPVTEGDTPVESTLTLESLRTFPLRDMCVDQLQQYFALQFCPCNTRVCIQKCCTQNQYINISLTDTDGNGGCQTKEEDGEFNVPDWRPDPASVSPDYYLIADRFPTCRELIVLRGMYRDDKGCDRDRDEEFVLHRNGSAEILGGMSLDPYRFCGEVTWHEDDTILEQNLVICTGKGRGPSGRLRQQVYGSLFIIGGITLFATVVVSLYLPSMHRRIHHKIGLCHNISLMIAYFTWGIVQLSTSQSSVFCVVCGLLIQFTFLASYFWLNVMCIDISITFCGSGASGSGNRRFQYYSLYSWGAALGMSIFTILMEFLPELPHDSIRPKFSCSCGFISKNHAILIYLYGPMLILTAVNLILFFVTVYTIRNIKRQTDAVMNRADSNTTGQPIKNREKASLILFTKLFLLMGLTWFLEILSWLIGGKKSIWYFTDTINMLRPVFIFVIFMCKKKVWRSLRNRMNSEPSSQRNSSSATRHTARFSHRKPSRVNQQLELN